MVQVRINGPGDIFHATLWFILRLNGRVAHCLYSVVSDYQVIIVVYETLECRVILSYYIDMMQGINTG